MLIAEQLKFAYPRGVVIAFPDIALRQAEVLLLKGASGSGKSTLLALCCGLLSATSGRLQVAGQDMALLSGAKRDAWRGQQVGFLPQRLHLSDSLTVRSNLACVFFAAGLAENTQKIEQALMALDVLDLAERRPSELSGGQAQRVALARATLRSPKIILADEPTASLDDQAAKQAMALLLEAAQRCGASLVVATHDGRVKEALVSKGQAVHDVALQNLNQIGGLAKQNMRKVL